MLQCSHAAAIPALAQRQLCNDLIWFSGRCELSCLKPHNQMEYSKMALMDPNPHFLFSFFGGGVDQFVAWDLFKSFAMS